MHVLLAPDKFKGSLTAAQVCSHLSAGIRTVTGLAIQCLPVADGGDGTVAAALAAGFQSVQVHASGPTGERLSAEYARRGDTAVIELAAICGLQRLPDGRLDPLGSSSYGVGEVVLAALAAGCRQIVLGIGGSASTDGGLGMLTALGAQARDAGGTPVPVSGAGLGAVATLDLSGLPAIAREATFVLATDVDNPLYGPDGAAAVYGPQKGASADEVATLDAGLRNWARVVTAATGADRSMALGAGAAGGVGFGAVTVLGATARPGIDLVLELVGLADRLSDCCLVVTGEGSLDEQSLAGKAPVGVAAAAGARGIGVVAVAGRCLLGETALAAAGIMAAYPLTDLEPDVQRCISQAGPLLERAGAAIARDFLVNRPR